MPYSLRLATVVPLLLGLGGCSLYVPTIPSTPLLRKGQVQVSGGTRSLTSLEAGAAWAPTDHLLLSAESAFQSDQTNTTDTNNQTQTYNDYHRQFSVGAGYYRAPTATSRWYLAALGGAGWASSSLHAVDVSWFLIIPLPYISGDYEARYRRYYVQAYAARPTTPLLTTGYSLRITGVDYTTLTLDGRPLTPTNHLFLEPTFFLKLGTGAIQGQGTFGFSAPLSQQSDSPLNKRTSPWSSLFGLSVIIRPDFLWHPHE